eukprot:TRINITY_DN1033_c1_g2_i1.p1 TRINITY_DN1033_c1_g2~~TRINITY_DN1033_c1_g2_i1.p1  ORF type:complete len:812 (+),score=281.70 TRINITY_DN1033_c1_g2_i1:112-2547(+)
MEIPQNYYVMLPHQQGNNNSNKSTKYKYKENIENYAPGNNMYYFNGNNSKKQQMKNINNITDPENNPPFSRLFVTCGKEMEEEELNSIFEEYGEMSSCKLLKEKQSSESKDVFNGNNSKKQQMKNINNITDPENNPPFSRLFVTCGKEMEEEELNSIFEEYGEMSSCKLLKEKQSSESKGIAFVKYKKASSAAKAIECLDNKILEGQAQPIKVQIADMKGTNNKIKKKVYSKEPEDTPARSRLFVVCPKEMTEETLTNKFRGISEELEYCKVITNKITNESKGFAYAKFLTASSAANAMEAIQETGEINGMKVKVLIADPKVKKSNDVMNGFYNPHFPHFDMMNVTSVPGAGTPQGYGAGGIYGLVNPVHMFAAQYGHQYPYGNSPAMPPQQSPPQQIPGGKLQDNTSPQGLHHPHQTYTAQSYIFHPSYPGGGSTPPVTIPQQPGGSQQGIHQMAIPQQQTSQSTLFIQVHTSITQDQLMELFSNYPSLEYCDLKLDHHTGESQGIAYINFSNPHYASIAKEELDGYEYPKGYPLKILFAAAENTSLSVINSPPSHVHQQYIQSPAGYHLAQSPPSPQYHYQYPSSYSDQYIYTPTNSYVQTNQSPNTNGYFQYFGSPPQLSTSPSHRNDLYMNQQPQFYQLQQQQQQQPPSHNFIDTRTILFSLPNPVSEKEIRMMLSRFGNIELIKFSKDNPLQGEITFNHPLSGYNAVYYNNIAYEKSIFLSLGYLPKESSSHNNNNNNNSGNDNLIPPGGQSLQEIDDSDDSQVFQIDDLHPTTPDSPLDDGNDKNQSITPDDDLDEAEDENSPSQ